MYHKKFKGSVSGNIMPIRPDRIRIPINDTAIHFCFVFQCARRTEVCGCLRRGAVAYPTSPPWSPSDMPQRSLFYSFDLDGFNRFITEQAPELKFQTEILLNILFHLLNHKLHSNP
jgi:hypothetical protein